MYGKEYLEWKEAHEAWQEIRAQLACRLSGLEPEVREQVLAKLRREYEVSNVDYNLVRALSQDAISARLRPQQIQAPLRLGGLFG